MKPPSDFAIAMRLAASFAEQLPEGCPFKIETDELWAVDLDIAARTPDEFWQAAIAFNRLPEKVVEVPDEYIRSFGNLHVSLYLWAEPEADGENG